MTEPRGAEAQPLMTRSQEIVQLFAFNQWARERLLGAVAALSDEQFTRDLGSSYPSVRATLVHIMSAEWVWLSRWNGISPTAMPAEWQSWDLAQIEAGWAALDAQLRSFVARLTGADLDRPVAYRSLGGDPFTSTLGQMLRHVVNHSTYHRGQVTTMLRQLGMPAPATDLILFYRDG